MSKKIDAIDGVRGGLALWVFWGHLSISCGASLPLLNGPALAVDLFMLMSGFLMCWHWDVNGQFWSQTRNFYVRRFFRIAPVYYVLLTIAFFAQSQFFAGLQVIDGAFRAHALAAESSSAVTIWNAIAHYSFVFGIFPHYSSNTPLPDWSISLEMQFYLAFPFLMLAFRRFGEIVPALIALVLAFMTKRLCGMYLVPGVLCHFPQPSMLFYKLNFFIVGMLMARCVQERDNYKRVYAFFPLALLVLLNADKFVLFGVFFITAILLCSDGLLGYCRNLLGSRLGRFLGDMSYSVYLCHSMVDCLILRYAATNPRFVALSPVYRFAIAAVVTTPMVYGLSLLVHRWVELPGIKFGRQLVHRASKIPSESRAGATLAP